MILVVDDDAQVRAFVRTLLRKCGYTVLEARDGHEALRLCQEQAVPVQLLITDIEIPGMSGHELADQALRIHPDLKILYISANPDNAVVPHGALKKEIEFLQKPFAVCTFERKVREILSAGGE